MKTTLAVAALALFGGSALAGGSYPGNPADFYLLSDAASEVYQYERTSPWNYVPGTYAGIARPMVFSNSSQTKSNAPYLGAVAGSNQDFFIGGFGSLTKISGSTGTFISIVGAPGTRLGPAKAPNGNIVVGGPTGTEEYDSNTGAFIRTVDSYGNGNNLHAFSGNTMYVTPWNSGGGVIKQFNFTTGLPAGPDIPVPFNPQKLAFGPDGSLYASALYESPTYEGVYRWSGSSWSLFADTSSLGGGGPHAFAWDPANPANLFISMNTGQIFRFDGFSGSYLNTIDTLPTKLTDILFKNTVPAPGTMFLLGAGGVIALRRRRA